MVLDFRKKNTLICKICDDLAFRKFPFLSFSIHAKMRKLVGLQTQYIQNTLSKQKENRKLFLSIYIPKTTGLVKQFEISFILKDITVAVKKIRYVLTIKPGKMSPSYLKAIWHHLICSFFYFFCVCNIPWTKLEVYLIIEYKPSSSKNDLNRQLCLSKNSLNTFLYNIVYIIL